MSPASAPGWGCSRWFFVFPPTQPFVTGGRSRLRRLAGDRVLLLGPKCFPPPWAQPTWEPQEVLGARAPGSGTVWGGGFQDGQTPLGMSPPPILGPSNRASQGRTWRCALVPNPPMCVGADGWGLSRRPQGPSPHLELQDPPHPSPAGPRSNALIPQASTCPVAGLLSRLSWRSAASPHPRTPAPPHPLPTLSLPQPRELILPAPAPQSPLLPAPAWPESSLTPGWEAPVTVPREASSPGGDLGEPGPSEAPSPHLHNVATSGSLRAPGGAPGTPGSACPGESRTPA